jgi:hypothetical protein
MFTRTKFPGSDDAIQQRIDVYCDAKTFAVIKERFPWVPFWYRSVLIR